MHIYWLLKSIFTIVNNDVKVKSVVRVLIFFNKIKQNLIMESLEPWCQYLFLHFYSYVKQKIIYNQFTSLIF